MSTTFKETYFKEELMRFRELMGQRQFWNKTEEERDFAIKGLAYVYFNVEPDDGSKIEQSFIDRMAELYSNTMDEYGRRAEMINRLALKAAFLSQRQ